MAQHRVLAREAGVRYHGSTNTRGFKSNWEVSAAFISTHVMNGAFFYGFLRTINLRSRLTILSNLNWDVKEPTRYSKRAREGTEFPVLWFVLHPSKKRQGVFVFLSRRALVILKVLYLCQIICIAGDVQRQNKL